MIDEGKEHVEFATKKGLKAVGKSKENPNSIKASDDSSDSITKVHFSENGSYKYITGKREPIAIRIDTGLYERFKPLAKRVYGSVCRAVEVHMVSFILAVESGVHFSNTEKPINIEKIVIERNLRPRRNLEINGSPESVVAEPPLPKCDFCGKSPVVELFRHFSGIEK